MCKTVKLWRVRLSWSFYKRYYKMIGSIIKVKLQFCVPYVQSF
jgi:hypothetical protein